ncbi:hypothetical protein [Glycomyces sp. YM15]|uniref:hypothetical protein n=1 Tax=Glycomyces sp. YM15 TaxID=2800446 RepID=UPI0019646FED|nr:hypothetical protein [Glycomyces sp. YM15]
MSEQFEFDREEALCAQAEGQLKAALSSLETIFASQQRNRSLLKKVLGDKLPQHRKRSAKLVRDALNELAARPGPLPAEIPYPPVADHQPGELRSLKPLTPLRPPVE